MEVAALRLLPAYLELREEFDAAYRRVMESGWYLLSRENAAFEREFAAYCHAPHCVAVGNGLDALHLALRALGVGPGDEVIVPAQTFIATWLAVTQSGATLVPVDVEDVTCNIDPMLVERAITPRTRVILPVHLYGHPADLDPILAIARARGVAVPEDAAQAHGALLGGRPCGSLGDAAAFSFYPGKNLGAFSDGGAVLTREEGLARGVRLLANYGSERRYHHDVQGINSRLDELQAAFLRVKLARLDEWNGRRAAVALRYLDAFAEMPGVILPAVVPGARPAWHQFVIRHARRDELCERLAARGVRTLIHYPVPPHLSGAYAALRLGAGAFPVAERWARESVSLPIGPHMTEGDVAKVIQDVGAATRALCG